MNFIYSGWIIEPFNNMRNLKIKSPPTVAFFAAINHNLNICICTLAIKGPWKTETYKETYKNNRTDRNPPITAKNVTFWPRQTHFICFLILTLCWLTATKNATVGGDLNFRFPMLLKGAVTEEWCLSCEWVAGITIPEKFTYKINLGGNPDLWVVDVINGPITWRSVLVRAKKDWNSIAITWQVSAQAEIWNCGEKWKTASMPKLNFQPGLKF